MILLIECETNKVIGVYYGYSYTPLKENCYSIKYEGDIPEGKGDLFFRDSIVVRQLNEEYSNYLAKQESSTKKNTLLKNIEVTYKDIIYQGDEESQSRISRAINSLSDETTTKQWKAKDNSIHSLNKCDLTILLYKCMLEQEKIILNYN